MNSRHLVIALTYYAPYVSGLTEVARFVAEGMAARGWDVTVVTTRHDPTLPSREALRGVNVIRTPVIARIGKGTLSPTFVSAAAAAARGADVLNLHLPMLEAGAIAALVRHTPIVSSYHCDVSLPAGAVNALQTMLIDASSRMALRRSDRIAFTTLDYATTSRVRNALGTRARAVGAPCRLREGGLPRFRDGRGLHVGFLGRIVEEKGLQYLVDGFRALDDPDARLLIAGAYDNVAGGSVIDRVRRHIGDDKRVRLLGFLPEEHVADFYASLDVFTLPSVNSLEAFGIVQVEALMLGIPVVATDIPGVRTPVRLSGLGRIVPPRDPAAITQALAELVSNPGDRPEGARRLQAMYGFDTVLDAYEELFVEAVARSPRAQR